MFLSYQCIRRWNVFIEIVFICKVGLSAALRSIQRTILNILQLLSVWNVNRCLWGQTQGSTGPTLCLAVLTPGRNDPPPVLHRHQEAKMAAAAVRTLGSSLSKNLREIRVHLCQSSAASKGARWAPRRHAEAGTDDTLSTEMWIKWSELLA